MSERVSESISPTSSRRGGGGDTSHGRGFGDRRRSRISDVCSATGRHRACRELRPGSVARSLREFRRSRRIRRSASSGLRLEMLLAGGPGVTRPHTVEIAVARGTANDSGHPAPDRRIARTERRRRPAAFLSLLARCAADVVLQFPDG